MRWNRADRVAAVENAPSFIAVLDAEGNLIDSDTSPEEAYLRAQRASPTGTVAIDSTVYGSDDRESLVNPAAALLRSAQTALRASEIDPVTGVSWSSFDPLGADKATVRAARESLRERGQEIYEVLLDEVAGMIHEPRRKGERKKRGGIAAEFDPAWLTGELLRQNQKMQKVLATGLDESYDSIGLSLLPHGASFRDPFDKSTDQGPSGVTFCKFSTDECRKVCLVNTGQRALESGAFAAGYLFSALIREMPREFLTNLFDRCVHEFLAAERRGFHRFIRLNVLSDLPWELLAPGFFEAVCTYARAQVGLRRGRHSMTDGLAFYDYTKIPYRQGLRGFYDLTFSFSGSRGLYPALFDVLEDEAQSAPRAAVVFVKRRERPIPKTGAYYTAAPGKPLSSKEPWHAWTFLGQKVYNGDLSDVRPLDPRGAKIIGLTYKPARYKVEPTTRGKKFGLVPVVDSTELDRELPTFLVRVRQPDPDAPPVVIATQDPTNRRLVLPTWKE